MTLEGTPPIGGSRRAAATVILLAAFAAGVAVWLLPASVHVVDWPRSGPHRIAVFAPLYRLVTLGLVTLAGAGTLLVLGRRDLGRLAHVVAPLNILWLWTVPYWPWLPDRLPLLLALSGPIRYLFAALAAGGLLIRVSRAGAFGALRPGRRSIFALSLAIYLGFGLRTLATTGLGGDEPHYLIITQSLITDGDLKIENNHARGDYRAYFPGDLRPDYMMRGVDRAIYSIHAPGLSVLLVPGFLAGGATGAVVTMCLLAALAALAVFDIARLVSGPGVAFTTWAVVCLTVPFIPHAWSLFPEMAGTAIVAWALLWGMQAGERTAAAWAWRGACLGCLPWLHTKFSVLMAGLALFLAWRLRHRWARMAMLLAPMAVSGVAWLASFYLIYGTINPEAPYGDYTARFVRVENIPRSVLGLLFDQKFGLLVYAPAFAIAIPGFWLLWRDRTWRAVAMASLGIALVFGISSARLYMWWGGSSAPARFLVPMTPLLAAAVAAGVQGVRSRTARAAFAACAVLSVIVGVAGAAGSTLYLLYSDPHGVSRMLDLLQGSAPLTAALPTFTQPEWIAPAVQLVPWVVAVVIASAVGWAVARVTPSGLWVVTGEVGALLFAAALLMRSFPAEARANATVRGGFALIDRFDPEHARAFDYARHARLSPAQWLDALRVVIDRVPGSDPDPIGRLTGALRLPAGSYDVRVWFDGVRRTAGALQANVGYDNLLARVDGPLPNPAVMSVILPVAVPSLWLQLTDMASARAVRRLELIARSVEMAGSRTPVDVAAVEAVPGWMRAYVAYVSGTYPEGGVFWTRGSEPGRLLLVPAGATSAALTVHVGPVITNVRIRIGRETRRLTLEPNTTTSVRIPLPAGHTVVPVEVQSDVAFRPADVDASSTDRRQLGCQVRLVLE